MAETMKAVRFHGKGDLRYEEIPVPELKQGHVKIRPAWVGICGSDLHECMPPCRLWDRRVRSGC